MTKRQKKDRNRILVSACMFFPLMIADHMGMLPARDSWLLWFIIYMIPYLIVGYDVVRDAFKGVVNRQMFDESFLMTIATIGAIAVGEFGEAVAVMLFYQVGELFQSYAVGKSRKSIKMLMDIAPEYADIEREDGSVDRIDPEEVEVGNILVIRPGEKIPVDGEVLEGTSMINTAALTGESVPRSAAVGDKIISGCINGEGLLKIRAEKKYEDSTVARILELVENAAERKARVENFITRFARYYTPVVVFGAIALAFLPPLVINAGIAMGRLSATPLSSWIVWMTRACTFLVISCPCALVISVPLSFFGGIGAASRKGVLVKGSNYLELLAEVHTIVSDKTGTLTKGNFEVSELILPNRAVHDERKAQEKLLQTAAMAEGFSTHPIAASIRKAWGKPVSTADLVSVENLSGRGICATVTDGMILAGNERLMEEHKIAFDWCDSAGTVIYVAKNNVFLGTIVIEDQVKPEAGEAVRALKKLGVSEFVILTGDRKAVADEVGRAVQADSVYAELLPEDKVMRVEELLQELHGKERLVFVGDGINDAPVLSRADVGIAMGSMGSDAAIEAADVVIMDDNIERIVQVIKIAKKTVQIAKENIVFAIGVKVFILILGAFGLANMWAAVFADVGVAVIAILNAMRTLATEKES